MMRIFIRAISILTTLFFCQSAAAQVPGQKTFSLQEDNRTLTINCIFKSNNGFMYVGTNSGLFSFDGENFTKLYFKNKDYTDTVTSIAQDGSQTIWAGFKSGRLARVVTGEVKFYDPEEGTPSKRISAICFDSEDDLWYAAYGEGIYQQKDNKQYLLNADNGLTDLNINTLCRTISGDVLAASDQGLVICPPISKSKQVSIITPSQGLPDYIVNTITAAGNNKFWIGLQDKGFCLYDHTDKKIVNLPAMAHWNYGEVNDLLQDGSELWIATQNFGLIRFDLKTSTFHPFNLPGATDIHQLLRDPQGNIWLNSHQNNLVSVKGSNLSIYPYRISGLYEKIHTILFDSDGSVWAGEDKGIYQFDFKNEKAVQRRVSIPVDLATDITALYEDAYKNIWIGTMGKGVFVFNKATNQLTKLTQHPGLANASVLSISGKNDLLYVCSLQGAMSINTSKQLSSTPATYVVAEMSNISGATHFVYSIFHDSKNRTWYATDGDGLWVQEKGDQLRQFGEQDGIKDGHIYSVTEDRKGNIWFSTASSGVYKYDGTSFTNFGLQQGISDLYISVVKTLGSGNIAVVNKNGIDIIDPLTGRVSYLESKNGIGAVNADNLGAVTIDDKGRILVVGEKGIVAYDLQPVSEQQPRTMIRSINLFENEIDSNQHVFSYDENNFTFHFIGLYFNDPSAVYYQYKLEGLDSNWVNTKDRSQTFPKLEPGKYTFKVRSSLNKNFTNAYEASFGFTIKTAFYKTWWFLFLCGTAIGLILYFIIRSREQQIRKVQQLQNEKMLFQYEVLRNQVNPHFLFNSFNTLISTIEEDPKMAVEYTEQLSDFFRDIVTYRDKDTILLSEELDLLHTYFFLQRKRYGAPLKMNVNISEPQKNAFSIPPLSLQLLVENAIKHNVVSIESPLLIEISFTAPDWITVVNKKNKRNIMPAGAGLGLQNIKSRFLLLTGREVMIENNETHFLIKLPLVPNESI